MNSDDIKLIEKYCAKDDSLSDLWREHVKHENRLDKLARKPFLNADEQIERNRLKKEKLLGRDRLEQLLEKYRVVDGEANA